MIEITQNNAIVRIDSLENKANRVSVDPIVKDMFIPISNFETKYPIELVKKILEIKGSDYLCDELAREEDPNYVQRDLEVDLQAYFPENSFAGKRILDFGCGSGASSMILSRLYPSAKIIGVELEEELLSIAKARLNFYKYPNIELFSSPSGSELPDDIGTFDLVIMSAVYEHLLPLERKLVMPLIWSKLKNNGCLFLNMTPHRYFPIEHHTTGLPLINYLPKSLAYLATRKYSKRTNPDESWETLLRRGIRGGTENEILHILRKDSSESPILVEPSTNNIRDRIDLWYSQLNQEKMKLAKNLIKIFMKTLRSITGIVLVPNLSLVFKKSVAAKN